MPTFCEECGQDMALCKSCGRDMCSHGCNGDMIYVDTPVARGMYCARCLGGPTEIHEKLRKFSREHGSPNALILQFKE